MERDLASCLSLTASLSLIHTHTHIHTHRQVLATLTGAQLDGCSYKHPLFARESPIVIGGDYITTEAGTGLVGVWVWAWMVGECGERPEAGWWV